MTREEIGRIISNNDPQGWVVPLPWHEIAATMIYSIFAKNGKGIDLGRGYVAWNEEQEDYILCPLEGRFSFDKVVKQNGRVVFIPEAK